MKVLSNEMFGLRRRPKFEESIGEINEPLFDSYPDRKAINLRFSNWMTQLDAPSAQVMEQQQLNAMKEHEKQNLLRRYAMSTGTSYAFAKASSESSIPFGSPEQLPYPYVPVTPGARSEASEMEMYTPAQRTIFASPEDDVHDMTSAREYLRRDDVLNDAEHVNALMQALDLAPQELQQQFMQPGVLVQQLTQRAPTPPRPLIPYEQRMQFFEPGVHVESYDDHLRRQYYNKMLAEQGLFADLRIEKRKKQKQLLQPHPDVVQQLMNEAYGGSSSSSAGPLVQQQQQQQLAIETPVPESDVDAVGPSESEGEAVEQRVYTGPVPTFRGPTSVQRQKEHFFAVAVKRYEMNGAPEIMRFGDPKLVEQAFGQNKGSYVHQMNWRGMNPTPSMKLTTMAKKIADFDMKHPNAPY